MTRSLSVVLLGPFVLLGAFVSLRSPGVAAEPVAHPAPAAQETSGAESHLGHMIGRWVADNPGAGNQDWVAYVIEVEWGDPSHRHSRGYLSGITKDGSEQLLWSMYAFWHPAQQRPVLYQVHVDGTLGHGAEVILEGATRTAEMWFVQPDGTMTFLRHEMRILDANSHVTSTLRRDESGEWRRLGTYTWQRDTSSAP